MLNGAYNFCENVRIGSDLMDLVRGLLLLFLPSPSLVHSLRSYIYLLWRGDL